MIVRRYMDPFTEMNAIRRQLNELFSDFTETAAKATWKPSIRLVDQGDDFVLTVHLAGVSAEDINVQVSTDVVSISGERKAPDVADTARMLYDDARYGVFQRVINLPDAVQNDQVNANFNNGVLTLTLPKVVEARNKVVKINLGAATPEAESATAES